MKSLSQGIGDEIPNAAPIKRKKEIKERKIEIKEIKPPQTGKKIPFCGVFYAVCAQRMNSADKISG